MKSHMKLLDAICYMQIKSRIFLKYFLLRKLETETNKEFGNQKLKEFGKKEFGNYKLNKTPNIESLTEKHRTRERTVEKEN